MKGHWTMRATPDNSEKQPGSARPVAVISRAMALDIEDFCREEEMAR
jgi:hypothetical protein